MEPFPNNMFSKVNPLDAVAAAKGFYTFKECGGSFSALMTLFEVAPQCRKTVGNF